jgi:hypothetical protein
MHRVRNLHYGSDDPRHAKKPLYYPRAAYGFLKDFRAEWESRPENDSPLTVRSATRDWQNRGLLEQKPSAHQKLLLQVLEANSADDIDGLARTLTSPLGANDRWLSKMDRWTRSCDPAKGIALIRELRRETRLSQTIREQIQHNVTVLSGLPPTIKDEQARKVTRRWDDD